jgi:hypothetical protein
VCFTKDGDSLPDSASGPAQDKQQPGAPQVKKDTLCLLQQKADRQQADKVQTVCSSDERSGLLPNSSVSGSTSLAAADWTNWFTLAAADELVVSECCQADRDYIS